jgi:hypothetical protein
MIRLFSNICCSLFDRICDVTAVQITIIGRGNITTSVTTFSITDLVIKTLIHYFTERFYMISPAVDSTPAPRHTQTL